MMYCHGCVSEYDEFCQCQVAIIRKALAGVKVDVPIVEATQFQVDEMRRRLHRAALVPTAEPIEIITKPSGTGFLVRKFV